MCILCLPTYNQVLKLNRLHIINLRCMKNCLLNICTKGKRGFSPALVCLKALC